MTTPKPTRTAGEILREMAERAKRDALPKPPPNAPTPPKPHHEPEETP